MLLLDYITNVTNYAIGDPVEVLQKYSADLVKLIIPCLCTVANMLSAKNLITFETKSTVLSIDGNSECIKASRLVNTLQTSLRGHLEPDKYLTDICNVLREQEHRPLSVMADSMLLELGK